MVNFMSVPIYVARVGFRFGPDPSSLKVDVAGLVHIRCGYERMPMFVPRTYNFIPILSSHESSLA